MTFWIYNPAEPTGQPTQAGVDFFRPFIELSTDNATDGRCGLCGACPPQWRMEVPYQLDSGGEEDPIEFISWGEMYGGTYYFRRAAYFNYGSARLTHCTWYTRFLFDQGYRRRADEKIKSIYDLSNFQYELGYGIFGGKTQYPNWWLYTPSLNEFGRGNRQSVYKFDGPEHEWKCLGENRFIYFDQLYGVDSEYLPEPWPYRPKYLTITPFYA